MTTPQAATQPTGRRDRQRQATRERILGAALALFREQGYTATSVDEIAEHADVARRTLFNHFERKQDLIAAWAGERRSRLSEILAEDSAHDSTAAAMLRHQFLTLAEMNEQDVPLATILVQGWWAEMSDLTQVFPIFVSFRDAVMLGQQAGEFVASVSPETMGEMLSSIYLDTLGRWVQPQASGSPAPFVLRDVLLAKLDVVLRGITQPGEPDTPTTGSRSRAHKR
jgi:TetR/AcrR family transcriptional regulator, cholesterol catabolism regulator